MYYKVSFKQGFFFSLVDTFCYKYSSDYTTQKYVIEIIQSVSQSSNFISSKLSSGAIAGLVAEGVIAVLAAAAAVFFYWRWKTTSTASSTPYTPVFRTPGTTTATATATGIAPSVETRSSPGSRGINTTFRPLATAGHSYQQLGNDGPIQGNIPTHVATNSSDSQISAGGLDSPGQVLNGVRTISTRQIIP